MPPIYFMLFTAGACAVWLLSLVGAWRRQPYYVFVLLFMVAYCFLSEFLAIRLGKYYYGHQGHFPWELCPTSTSPVPWPFSLFQHGSCPAPNLCIPIAVIFMESSLFMAILWTADRLTSSEYVKPFLTALMGVNIDAMIDPIASASTWCPPGLGSNYPGFGFWTWFITEQNPGYWFGVPLINYTTWFISMAAFTFVVRWIARHVLGDKRGLLAQLLAALLAMAGLLVIEFILILSVQYVLDLRSSLAWQGGVTLTLIGLGLLVVVPAVRGFKRDNPLGWIAMTPQLFFLLFFPIALLIHGGLPQKGWVWLVALVTFVIGAGFAFAPYSKSRLFQRRPVGETP